MRRRHFLRGLGAFLGWVSWPLGSGALAADAQAGGFETWTDRLPHSDPLERARDRLSLLRVSPSARVLGGEYLARFPEEADVASLLAALDCDAPKASSKTREAVAARERERAARDFAAGRVVELSGWLLSQREARICALASLV